MSGTGLLAVSVEAAAASSGKSAAAASWRSAAAPTASLVFASGFVAAGAPSCLPG
jgi:hypothetical protein